MSSLNLIDAVSKTALVITFDVVSTVVDPNKPTLYSTNWTPMYPYISRLINVQLPPGADQNSFNVSYWGLEFAFKRDQIGWTVSYQYSDDIFPIYTP